jgi:hypothetical protein
MAYKAELPKGVTLPDGHRIEVTDARFVALEQLATRERWSQAAFSSVLGLEAGRVSAAHASARAAAPAAAPSPAEKPDFSKMSTADKFAYALNNPKRG